MGVLWSKVYRDLWTNKGRTILVVLSIAIGATAIGMIMTTRDLVVPGMQNMWQAMHPAMVNIFVGPAVSIDQIYTLKKVKGVQDIEGMSNATIEWRINPQDEWKQGGINLREDYPSQRLNKIELVKGSWPSKNVVAINNGDDTFFKIPMGGTVYIRFNKTIYTFKVGGMVYNQLSQPALFGGTAQFFATIDDYERVVGNRDFTQLMVTAPQWDEKAVTNLAATLEDKLAKTDRTTFRLVTNPNKHFFQDSMDGLFLLLGVMGVLSLILGLLLVYNTVTALISRQVDQIGVMKAIGAQTGHILRLFLTTIFLYGLMALILAVPLGVLGGWVISKWLVGSFGANMGNFQISQQAIIAMALITLLAPLVASLPPIFSGARITVREAVSTYGLRTQAGLLERLLSKMKGVSRMVLLTISNTFRNKWRVVLMEITLVLSGLIFMMVISVRDSVNFTIKDVVFAILGADVTFIFENPQRIETIHDVTMAYPDVKSVESWGLASATLRPKGKPYSEDDKSTTLFGVPLPTQLYGYQLRSGRWLQPDDTYAVVLNKKLADDVGVNVGDWVTVRYSENHERDWLVVGLVFDPIITTSSNVSREVLLRDTNAVGRTSTVWIKLKTKDPQAQIQIAKSLRAYYDQNQVKVSAQRGVFGMGGDATVETAQAIIGQFNFMVILLAMMAIIIAIVGSIALSGAVSLSVMERRREIGVMRAIGASSRTVSRLFIGEGLILGWLSWLIALPLSIPAGKLMVQALGAAFKLNLVYHYTPTGDLLWLFIITILSIVASWLPARGATRISVRESLAYQ